MSNPLRRGAITTAVSIARHERMIERIVYVDRDPDDEPAGFGCGHGMYTEQTGEFSSD